MERGKKTVFICLYIALWLVWAWTSRRTPLSAVLMAVIYWLVLAGKKPGHYILYVWCGFLAALYGITVFRYWKYYMYWEPRLDDAEAALSPMAAGVPICFALAAASIILTVIFRKALKTAGAEKERIQAEKRQRRLDIKTQREQRSRGGSK